MHLSLIVLVEVAIRKEGMGVPKNISSSVFSEKTLTNRTEVLYTMRYVTTNTS